MHWDDKGVKRWAESHSLMVSRTQADGCCFMGDFLRPPHAVWILVAFMKVCVPVEGVRRHKNDVRFVFVVRHQPLNFVRGVDVV